MVVQLFAVLAAAVSCGGIIFATSRYLRVRHDFFLRNGWRSTVLFGAGLVLSVHTVSAGIDQFVGVPNLARWLENAILALAGYFADSVHIAMIRGIAESRRQRWAMLAYLVVTVCAMAYLLWRAHVPDLATFSLQRPDSWLILYRAVWLGYLTVVIVRLIVYNWRFGHMTPDPIISLTTLAMIVAGCFALGVIVTTMAEPVVPASSPAVLPLRTVLEICVLGMASSFIFSTLPTWSPRMGGPTVARFLVSAAAYLRLGHLWRAVTRAAPEVVLPTTIGALAVLRHPSDMELLLQRRVTEIIDGWRLLIGHETERPSPPASASATSRTSQAPSGGSFVREGVTATMGNEIVQAAHAWEVRLEEMERAADVDAGRLMAALDGAGQRMRSYFGSTAEHSAGASSELLSFRPETFAEQVRYLEVVARMFTEEYHRSGPVAPPRLAGES